MCFFEGAPFLDGFKGKPRGPPSVVAFLLERDGGGLKNPHTHTPPTCFVKLLGRRRSHVKSLPLKLNPEFSLGEPFRWHKPVAACGSRKTRASGRSACASCTFCVYHPAPEPSPSLPQGTVAPGKRRAELCGVPLCVDARGFPRGHSAF